MGFRAEARVAAGDGAGDFGAAAGKRIVPGSTVKAKVRDKEAADLPATAGEGESLPPLWTTNIATKAMDNKGAATAAGK